MLNKLQQTLVKFQMVNPGDKVICALSGGADSVALLFGMYLIREKLDIQVEATHFNHNLRGAESDRDEAFVKDLCGRFDIPLHLGSTQVTPGKKGLEAAAREARYRFFDTLDGKIATAHTADDNAETVLMHLVRGTGLKGLGGIAPVRGRLIRPMLEITRGQVLAFLKEYHLTWVEDSSNAGDDFLRNRLRHHVLPLLYRENPQFAENTSAMAMALRLDDAVLEELAAEQEISCAKLRQLPEAVRSRCLRRFLEANGVKEPESDHVALANALVFSENPSARGHFPGNITICRSYDKLIRQSFVTEGFCYILECPGKTYIPEAGLTVICTEAEKPEDQPHAFTIPQTHAPVVRSRRAGDTITRSGGTKTLKKLFVDRKIPAHRRLCIPVIAEDDRILGVYGIGSSLQCREQPAVWRLEFVKYSSELER